MKLKLLVFNILISISLNAQITNTINSNRPGESFGAYSIGKKVFQLETGIYYDNQDHKLLQEKSTGFGAEIDLRYGFFFEQLEFIGEIDYKFDKFTSPYIQENRNAFNGLRLGAKFLVYDPWKKYIQKENIYSWNIRQKFKWRNLLPAVSIYAGANFNVGDNPYTFTTDPIISPKIMVLLQQIIAPRWVITTNIIADKITTDYPSYGYILTVTHGFNRKWSGFVESQGYKSDFYADHILRGGAAYLLKKNLQFDASLGFNFKDTPQVLMAGIGMSWRWDKKHKGTEVKGLEQPLKTALDNYLGIDENGNVVLPETEEENNTNQIESTESENLNPETSSPENETEIEVEHREVEEEELILE